MRLIIPAKYLFIFTGLILLSLSVSLRLDITKNYIEIAKPYIDTKNSSVISNWSSFFSIFCFLLFIIQHFSEHKLGKTFLAFIDWLLDKKKINKIILAYSAIFFIINLKYLYFGYFFYDDFFTLEVTEKIKSSDLLFANSGSFPLPLYFIFLKVTLLLFGANSYIFNIYVFSLLLLLFIISSKIIFYVSKNILGIHIFFILYMCSPTWRDFYTGSYIISIYIQAVLFFTTSILFYIKYINSNKNKYIISSIIFTSMTCLTGPSGLWAIPFILLWSITLDIHQNKHLNLIKYLKSKYKFISLLIISTIIISFYYLFFYTYIYTHNDTIRYDYNRDFSIYHLIKNFSIVISYIFSYPIIPLSYQGSLPTGFITNLVTLISFSSAITFFVLLLRTLTKNIFCAYFLLLTICNLLMIAIGRYAADLDRIIFPNKYTPLVLTFYFIFISIAIGYLFSNTKKIKVFLIFIPVLFSIYIHQHFMIWAFEEIQSIPPRTSLASSENRRTFYEQKLPEALTIISEHSNNKKINIPLLNHQHIFSCISDLNGPYDLSTITLQSYIKIFRPEHSEKIHCINLVEDGSDSKISPIFKELLQTNNSIRNIFLNPVYFSNSNDFPDAKLTSFNNEIIVSNKPIDLILGNPKQKNIKFRKLTFSFAFQGNSSIGFHKYYTNEILIEVSCTNSFSKTLLGFIKISNLSSPSRILIRDSGIYNIDIDLFQSIPYTLSDNISDMKIILHSPGVYKISNLALKNI